jgi:hypothetical protein
VTKQEDSRRQAGTRTDHVLESMRRACMTIDRENYIWKAYGADPPEWGPELEAELPQELQDWSQFEREK